ncbi:hypothetical protein L596_013310 [Steinernema carpocapsae]|uniref:Uncharacterized protein n=1 Tax=Steinernema carpocapsae TaxID=34508 RepID=A0A4U5NZU1_STECR|nr:hypothetical protein L596_013310 [Steinernema carpocapsae]
MLRTPVARTFSSSGVLRSCRRNSYLYVFIFRPLKFLTFSNHADPPVSSIQEIGCFFEVVMLDVFAHVFNLPPCTFVFPNPAFYGAVLFYGKRASTIAFNREIVDLKLSMGSQTPFFTIVATRN